MEERLDTDCMEWSSTVVIQVMEDITTPGLGKLKKQSYDIRRVPNFIMLKIWILKKTNYTFRIIQTVKCLIIIIHLFTSLS